MTGNLGALVSAEDVMGVLELGAHILGFLDDLEDLRNAALTSRRFNRAAHFHLWTAIRLPYLDADPSWADRRPFWDRFALFLRRNTTSLRTEMPVVAPGLFREISMKRWEAPVSGAAGTRWLLVKEGVDFFFAGLKEVLTRAPRLRDFAARDVPRVLDLVVLLHRHHPQLVTLDITASRDDTFGFLSVPAYNMVEWRFRVRNDPNHTVPLGNTVNFGLDINLAPVFNFTNLRVLALDNIHLSHLSLSLRHRPGGITPSGQSRPYYTINNLLNGPRDALGALCHQYRAADSQPLRLKTLTLGYGFEICDDVSIQHVGPLPRPHPLESLTDLTALEGLHMDGLHRKEGSRIADLGQNHGYSLISARIPPGVNQLPQLRKLTWPWEKGRLLQLLWTTSATHQRRLILRIETPSPTDFSQPSPTDFSHPANTPYPTWVGNWLRYYRCCPPPTAT
ncbi:hypothetical protein F5144DRAFT_661740 [Chaetomium tenue]|uniref:Uncharacterized protein n=1 Tax=Chaetomium tenue TaxID=1854479 RepID=A0ACB7NW38_9PEZI|nr:hypothetical protein F5144DRAFT_661740 [Chaetomium globosum]